MGLPAFMHAWASNTKHPPTCGVADEVPPKLLYGVAFVDPGVYCQLHEVVPGPGAHTSGLISPGRAPP